MADLGKVSITDAGNYSASTTYEKLTFVHYNGDTYMTLKTVKGVVPNDDGVNYRLFTKSAILATASLAGLVKPASTDFTVASSDGTQKINLGFTEANSLANISSKDSWLTILGKIAKAISTVITVNTSALLKSVLSNVDVNDSNKIPTSALLHSLWNRIGMGSSLGVGSNLTDAVNLLNSNLNETKVKLDMVHNLSLTDFVTDFNGGGNAIRPGRWRVYNASGTAANGPYSGSVGGYVDITINGDMTVSGSEAYQILYDSYGDVYFKVIKAGTGYGTWKKLT